MEDEMLEERLQKYDRLTIQQMIERAGNSDTYQWRMFLIFFFCWFSSAFIQMGFPIIFQPAQFQCQGSDCDEQYACQNNLPLSDSVKSVAYTFNLTCDRKRYLNICFNAFLYGGFIGSLYYGQIIQRKGRRYAAIQSILMMVCGLYLSLVSGNVILFSIGVFFFNAGFRGFYNASLLCLTQVMNQVSRTATPMVLSIGWALGQIIIAIIGIFISSWRVIFFLTAVPLSILLWYTYKFTKRSPRFLVVKHEFEKARNVVEEIALINGNTYGRYEMVEEISYKQKMRAYHEIMGQGEIQSTLKHHSYLSLFKYNSIRIRVIIVGLIWSLFSLSYFISANSFVNPDRGIPFNIALAGVVQIIAYMVSILTSLNYSRIFFIKRLLLTAGIFHICYYFIGPLNQYHGFSKFIVMTFDLSIRVIVSVGNTFLAIYALELFPTSIRHFALGMLGFITKLMYMLSTYFNIFWSHRQIHPNFIIGALFFGSYFMVAKLRETHRRNFKDNLSEDGDGTMMDQMRVNII